MCVWITGAHQVRPARMHSISLPLLKAGLLCYLAGVGAGLILVQRPRLANFATFSLATAGSTLTLLAAVFGLGANQVSAARSVELWTALMPNARFSVKLDALSSFFLLIISLLG